MKHAICRNVQLPIMPILNELWANTTIPWCRILKRAQLLSWSRIVPQFYRKDHYCVHK